MAISPVALKEVDSLARHLCERIPAETNEQAKKYVARIWEIYLKIAGRPGVALPEEAARKKQFEKTVTSTLKN